MRILVIEDNTELAQWLCRDLGKSGYTVDHVSNGADGNHALRSEKYDLVILDLHLPKVSGSEILTSLRARNDATPVLVLTANNTLNSRVNVLDQGADDYLAKPFEVEELQARVRMLLRRFNGHVSPVITCGDISFNSNSREFSVREVTLELTPRERSVLEVLIRKSGTTVHKNVFAQSLFAWDDEASVDAIEIYIHRVRKKISHSSSKIITIRGLGYLLQEVGDGP